MAGAMPNPLNEAKAGNAEALRALLETHGPGVWRTVASDIGAKWQAAIDADDVMQVTYLEAFLRIGDLCAEDEAAFAAWLRSIARNNLRDAIKELERKKRPPQAKRIHAPQNHDSYVTLIEHLGTSSSTPSRHVARAEAAEAIDAMLTHLPEDYARVIRAYDLEGGSIGAVAEAMGRSAGAVHMLRARAHDALRSLLGAETDFFTHTA